MGAHLIDRSDWSQLALPRAAQSLVASKLVHCLSLICMYSCHTNIVHVQLYVLTQDRLSAPYGMNK